MRDINLISSIGIPIQTQSGYQGGISIPNTYKFEHSFFSTEEIEDLVLAFHLISKLRQSNTKSSILKKLELLVPELTFLKENDFADYFQIELFQDPLIQNEKIFQDINTALDKEVIIELKIKNHKYCVAPLSYALRTSGLYLYASDGEQLFDFPISDIVYCELTDQSFERQDYQKFRHI